MIAAVAVMIIAAFVYLFFPFYALQWPAAMVMIIVSVSYAYREIVRRNLRVERKHPNLKTYLHVDATVEIIVENRSWLPIPYIAVSDSIGILYGADRNRLLTTLRGRQRFIFSYTIRGNLRGLYSMGPIRVRFADPLGLFPWWNEVRAPGTLVIYPRVYPVNLATKRGVPSGSIRVANPIYEDMTRYRSIREYVPGDELRTIAWKVSARMGTLHTIQYLPAVSSPCLVLLNLTATDYRQRNRFHNTERSIEAAASLAYFAIAQKQDVGLITTGIIRGTTDMPTLPSVGGQSTVVMETLARIDINPEPIDTIARLFANEQYAFGTRVMYVGPAFTPDQFSRIASSVPRRTRLEFFFTDERVAMNPLPPVFPIYRLTEQGEKLIAE